MLGSLTAVLDHCLRETPGRSEISVLDVSDAVAPRSVVNALSLGHSLFEGAMPSGVPLIKNCMMHWPTLDYGHLSGLRLLV